MDTRMPQKLMSVVAALALALGAGTIATPRAAAPGEVVEEMGREQVPTSMF